MEKFYVKAHRFGALFWGALLLCGQPAALSAAQQQGARHELALGLQTAVDLIHQYGVDGVEYSRVTDAASGKTRVEVSLIEECKNYTFDKFNPDGSHNDLAVSTRNFLFHLDSDGKCVVNFRVINRSTYGYKFSLIFSLQGDSKGAICHDLEQVGLFSISERADQAYKTSLKFPLFDPEVTYRSVSIRIDEAVPDKSCIIL